MLHGIDISHHQPSARMRYELAGDFAYVRATYGTTLDREYRNHVRGFRDAGIPLLGAYHFFRQHIGAQDQAEAFLGQLDSEGFGVGDLVPVIDLEHDIGAHKTIIPEQYAERALEVCRLVWERYGCILIYCVPYFYQNLKGHGDWVRRFPMWVADYGKHNDGTRLDGGPRMPPGSDEWVMWQYTGNGAHPAYPGALDLNDARYLLRTQDMTQAQKELSFELLLEGAVTVTESGFVSRLLES